MQLMLSFNICFKTVARRKFTNPVGSMKQASKKQWLLMAYCLLIAICLHISHSTRVIVLRVESGAPFGIFDIYSNSSLSGYFTSENKGKQYTQYKSEIINDWTRTNILRVIINVYSGTNVAAFFEFNGRNTNSMNWMSKSRLLKSAYTDIDETTLRIAHVSYQDSQVIRRFYMLSQHAGCMADNGWLALIDSIKKPICRIDQVDSTTIWYSDLNVRNIFNEVTCEEDVLVVSNTSHSLTGFQYNDTVTYQCLVGFYHTAGDLTRRCTHLAVWSGSSPICTQCLCESKQAAYIKSNDTEAIETSINKIKSELSIKANETSMAQRRKISAGDSRPSATAVGSILGGVLLASLVLLIIVSDATVLFKHFKMAVHNVKYRSCFNE